MKTFILITESESGDSYSYVIKSNEKPTREQIVDFLEENANDKDEECYYEYQSMLIDIENSEIYQIDN